MKLFGYNITRKGSVDTGGKGSVTANARSTKQFIQNESLKALAAEWKNSPQEAVDFGRQLLGIKKPNVEDVMFANVLANNPDLQLQLAQKKIEAMGLTPKKTFMEEYMEMQKFVQISGMGGQQPQPSGFAQLMSPEVIGGVMGILQMVMENAKSNQAESRPRRTSVRDIPQDEITEARPRQQIAPQQSIERSQGEEDYNPAPEVNNNINNDEPTLEFNSNRVLRVYVFRLADLFNDPNISPEQAAMSALNGLEGIAEQIKRNDPDNKLPAEIYGTLQLEPTKLVSQLAQLAAYFQDERLTKVVAIMKTSDGLEYLQRFHNEIIKLINEMEDGDEAVTEV